MCLWERALRVFLGPQGRAETQTSQPPPQHVCHEAPLERECAPPAHPHAFMFSTPWELPLRNLRPRPGGMGRDGDLAEGKRAKGGVG